jgi:NTP pyrophosphatase (non-canonical NTP hydrolase)
MTFDEYQKAALSTAIFPGLERRDLLYAGLGLSSEAGEVAGKLKKFVRDYGVSEGTQLSLGMQNALKDELGDCAWYLAVLASMAGLTLDEVLVRNLEKLASRAERGVIQGSGDTR